VQGATAQGPPVTTPLPVFDCIVFSGGGAKAAFGAGAAKALTEYRRIKRIDTSLCLLGASAGALTAATLATSGADKTLEFWREASNRAILGVRLKNTKFQVTKRWVSGKYFRSPFSVYGTAALEKFLESRLDFDGLKGKHLILAVTDYTDAKLKAFYHSDLVDAFVREDQRSPVDEQRLQHFHPLTRENFGSVLRASSAIPVIFPPVRIEDNLYVDGGLGNNTPTREAAYFLRNLKDLGTGGAGEVYVISLEPPRKRRDSDADREGLLGIVERALSIYHHVHTAPILGAWHRINDEVVRYENRLEKTKAAIRESPGDPATLETVIEKVEAGMGHLGGTTPRLNVPLHVIEPSTELGETLSFDRKSIDGNIRAGYQEALQCLRHAGKVTEGEYRQLLDLPL